LNTNLDKFMMEETLKNIEAPVATETQKVIESAPIELKESTGSSLAS